jgi:hypothetical protein
MGVPARAKPVVWWSVAAAIAAALVGCTRRPAGLELRVLTSRPATGALDAGLAGRLTDAGPAKYLEDRGVLILEREWSNGLFWERRFVLTEAGREPPVESHYRLRDGALELVEEINHEERVEVVFDPPLVVLPAVLHAGRPYRQNLKMTVHPLGDRSRIKARGPVKQTIRFESIERIGVPAGEFDAAKVTAVFNAVLAPAEVKNTTDLWLALDVESAEPLLAERREEVTRVLFLPTTKRRLLVLERTETD